MKEMFLPPIQLAKYMDPCVMITGPILRQASIQGILTEVEGSVQLTSSLRLLIL